MGSFTFLGFLTFWRRLPLIVEGSVGSHCVLRTGPGLENSVCVCGGGVCVILLAEMRVTLLPSWATWTAQYPSVTLGGSWGPEVYLLGEEMDCFLVQRWGASSWGHQIHSYYLRTDLCPVRCCVPRARPLPRPQCLQHGR